MLGIARMFSIVTPLAPPLRQARRGQPALILLLAVVGAVLFGQGLYIHAKALLAQVLLERAFALAIASGQPVKPWSWADTVPVARVAVPRLKVSAIVLAGSSGQALAFGPGHLENTAEPGEHGIAVFAAHRDTHFSFLKDVAIGDEIVVTRRDGRTFRYRADRAAVVRFDNTGLDPLSGQPALVLSTCWPFDAVTSGPLRYVLHATMAGEDAPRTAAPIRTNPPAPGGLRPNNADHHARALVRAGAQQHRSSDQEPAM